MEIQDILNELQFLRDKGLPREALEAAIAQREAITPGLLGFIEHAYANADHLDDDGDQTRTYVGHLYAMYLLAQFREKAAYPLIVKFFGLPGELAFDITGDLATESLPNILASVACGDTSLIKAMVENPELNEWVRGAGVRAFLCLVAAGEMSREEAVAYYAELFRGKLERQSSNAWDSLVAGAADLRADELREDLERAYAEDIPDPFFIRPEEVETELAEDKSQVPERLKKRRYGLIEDTIEELESWDCFRPKRPIAPTGDALARPPQPAERPTASDVAPPLKPVEPVQAIHVASAPSRNDPCPCGSGRKYKHCCAGKPTKEA